MTIVRKNRGISDKRVRIAGKELVIRTVDYNEGKGYTTCKVGVLGNIDGERVFKEINNPLTELIGSVYYVLGRRKIKKSFMEEPSLPSRARK